MCYYYITIAKPPFTKPLFVNSRGVRDATGAAGVRDAADAGGAVFHGRSDNKEQGPFLSHRRCHPKGGSEKGDPTKPSLKHFLFNK